MIDWFTLSISHDPEAKRKYRWHIAISLLILFLIGSLLNIPFSQEVKRLNIEAGHTEVHLPDAMAEHVLQVGMSSLVLGAILIWIGLWVAPRAGLGAPLLAQVYAKGPVDKRRYGKMFWSSILLAVFAAGILLLLFELQQEFYPVTGKIPRPGKSYYATVSFSAGISEEIMIRLGLMSLIVATITYVQHQEVPSAKIVWVGIITSALFFGLIHLPLSKNFAELTPFTISVTMLGNLITGSLFGWIYWKRGLLMAIAAHIAFDLVFHVVGSPYV